MTYKAVVAKSRSVNSKQLLQYILGVINEVADDMIMVSHIGAHSILDFDQLTEFLEMFMEELADRKSITTWEVICDHRNNPSIANVNGPIYLTIVYKQYNCLNTTSVDFVIED